MKIRWGMALVVSVLSVMTAVEAVPRATPSQSMRLTPDQAAEQAQQRGKFRVRSDRRSFNPFNASYHLKGNVEAEFPTRGKIVRITADDAVAHFFSQRIDARGSVQLYFDEIYLSCDKARIFNRERTAYLYGNVRLKYSGDEIVAPEGKYNWRENLAHFFHAERNGQPVEGTVVIQIKVPPKQ